MEENQDYETIDLLELLGVLRQHILALLLTTVLAALAGFLVSSFVLTPQYQANALRMHQVLESLDIWHTGGINSPYLWMRCPGGQSSWEFFQFLLERAQVVGTPGSGFGQNGEGFFRLTAFGSPEDTAEAMERIRQALA